MKYIYLDQMHWINLAKAVVGRPDGSDYVQILSDATATARSGEVVFPLSCVHCMETARAPKTRQRSQLANLMTSLSRGTVLRWSRPLIEFQLRNATRRMFAEPLLGPEPSPFGRGVEEAFDFDVCDRLNLSPERTARLRAALDTPEAWMDLLSHKDEESRMAGIQAVDRVERQAVRDYEARRIQWDGIDRNMAQRAYAVFLTQTFWEELQRSLHEIGRSVDDWGKAGPSRLLEFWESIPSLQVEIELATQLTFQKSRPWNKTDDRDIGALSLAIPSCDVVVTERFWVDIATRRKLGERHGTVLLRDLRDLSGWLRDQ